MNFEPLDLSKAAPMMCDEIENKSQNGWSAGKIGTSEFNAIRWYVQRMNQRVQDSYPPFVIREMTQNAGLWTPTTRTIDSVIDEWAEETIKAIKNLNVAVSWSPSAKAHELELLNTWAPKAKKVVLRALEPYYTPDNQYTQKMTRGKIAVVSPFADSIATQWLKRTQIFPESGPAGKMWLDNQEIIPIKAFYGPTMTPQNYSLTWTQEILDAGPLKAVEFLCQEVVNSGAKYAFVGIGALSLPLVNKLKNNGITAIHTGGGTQIMFGVKGNRWSNHDVISKLFNDNWIKPNLNEIPSAANKVEGGCYW